ncbi:RNA polymerase factor sigma-54 [Sinorhizobium meliloti]|nr:hypothetical protein [Sinorhizobium meliloti]
MQELSREPLAVLSDDDVDVLKKTGVDIARRTLAKYRGAMTSILCLTPLREACTAEGHGALRDAGSPRAGGSGGSWSEIAHQPSGSLGRSLLFPRGGNALAFTAAKHMRQKFCRSRSRKKEPLPRAACTASSPLQRATRRALARSQGLPRTAAIR